VDPGYSETLIDHFRHPRGVGEVDRPDAEARVVSPVHGDELRLTFAIEADRIAEVRFRCRGCVVAIAAASAATTLLEGRTLAEALALTDEDVVAALDGVPEAKRRCSLIVSETVRAALGRFAWRPRGT
jgi:nitrogen fixation NifU-like protein